MAFEVEKKNQCQREREKLRKQELAWKKEYQTNISDLTSRIQTLKSENTQFVGQVSTLYLAHEKVGRQ